MQHCSHCAALTVLLSLCCSRGGVQGTRGICDVKRAFHGLLARRSEIFWHFVAGFCLFLLVFLALLWVKLDEAIGSDEANTTMYLLFGGAVTLLG